jgi:predicted transcriptional regulator
MDPLKYGKLLDKIGNRYFIQINNKNIAIINHLDGQNEVKFFKSGELTYEYIDKFIDEITFKRILGKK